MLPDRSTSRFRRGGARVRCTERELVTVIAKTTRLFGRKFDFGRPVDFVTAG